MLVLWPAALTGCATSLSAAAAPSVDTTGHFGGEGRVSLAAAAGSPSFRMFVGLGAGVGYLDGFGSGYATVTPELGFEGGRKVQWSAIGFYAPKLLFQGPYDVAHGVGAGGQVLFHVRRTGGEDGAFLLGPRLSLEAVAPDFSESSEKDAVALLQLSLVFRWVTFDTTGKSWTR